MLHPTRASLRKIPKNMNVAPDYDTWWKKYDAWSSLTRMRRLVGTGFYIPPEWYNHFRMFPPPHNTAPEETTENPHAHLPHQKSEFENANRMELRDALAKSARSAATAGNRYMNLFWVVKPLDEMERAYYRYVSDLGLSHEDAVQKVVKEYYAKEATRSRVHAIQLEEAKMSGKFLTMREGLALIHTLGHLNKTALAPHEVVTLGHGIAHHTAKRRTRRKGMSKGSSTLDETLVSARERVARGAVGGPEWYTTNHGNSNSNEQETQPLPPTPTPTPK